MSQNIFTAGLGYEGKVTLTLKSNNRVLHSKVYKNSGTTQLFKFLCYCLTGSYEDARWLLPTKIMLLNNNSSENGSIPSHPTNVESRSSFKGRAQAPLIINDSLNEQVKVVYSFEIPQHNISGEFNQVALYGEGISQSEVGDFSAFYYLVDDSGKLSSMNPSTWSVTTTLLIEWELIISNKNTEVTKVTI